MFHCLRRKPNHPNLLQKIYSRSKKISPKYDSVFCWEYDVLYVGIKPDVSIPREIIDIKSLLLWNTQIELNSQ